MLGLEIAARVDHQIATFAQEIQKLERRLDLALEELLVGRAGRDLRQVHDDSIGRRSHVQVQYVVGLDLNIAGNRGVSSLG